MCPSKKSKGRDIKPAGVLNNREFFENEISDPRTQTHASDGGSKFGSNPHWGNGEGEWTTSTGIGVALVAPVLTREGRHKRDKKIHKNGGKKRGPL